MLPGGSASWRVWRCSGATYHGAGSSGALVGTVFAHRLFDLFPALLLILYVIATAKVPHWAVTSLLSSRSSAARSSPSRS